ncbi:MAG: oligopeptide/dipeptide ABC transporter ATP-binding protein [Dehalococcoidia bacterium]
MIQTAESPAAPSTYSAGDGPLLDVRDLKVHFPISRGLIIQRKVGAVKAVDGVSFSINPGETLGLVGESGSGKTTTGRAIIQLTKPTSGDIIFEGKNLSGLKSGDLRRTRRRFGMVFQDPYGSLNPRMSAGNIVGEPLIVHRLYENKADYREKVADLFNTVGLSPTMADRYPHEFSGGQRQRLGVARALAVRPSLMVLDEPVSALDVSIQAQVINLLQDLQEEFNLAYLFIAHDLSVVRHISNRVAVMYLGRIVEIADRDELYDNPLHPYTQALLSAVPMPNPLLERKRERIVLKGDMPSPANPPPGCVFHTRCPVAIDECRDIVPELREVVTGHWVACIRAPGYGEY